MRGLRKVSPGRTTHTDLHHSSKRSAQHASLLSDDQTSHAVAHARTDAHAHKPTSTALRACGALCGQTCWAIAAGFPAVRRGGRLGDLASLAWGREMADSVMVECALIPLRCLRSCRGRETTKLKVVKANDAQQTTHTHTCGNSTTEELSWLQPQETDI